MRDSHREYIVLQRKGLVVPEIGAMAAGLEFEPPSFVLHSQILSPGEKLDVQRDPRTKAIAEAMPMTLIEPVATAGAGPVPAAGTTTWGVDAVLAPTSPFDGTGITVAVLDTGIDPNHPAFQGVNLVRKNFTTDSDDDTHGHGTHCAGTIFGKDVGGVRIGIARNVGKALIGKVLGTGGNSSGIIAKAINWAVTEGANVISMSLAIDFPGYVDDLIQSGLDSRPATSIALEQYRANINLFNALAGFVEAQVSFGQGCILVAASGNESDRPNFEIAVAPPAAANGFVAVGALERGPNGFQVATFSNTQVNVSGPGVDIFSAEAGSNDLISKDGTSMATPHVAGIAALWAQRLRQMTGRVEARTLAAQLVGRATTASLDPSSEENDVGTGIVQAPQD